MWVHNGFVNVDDEKMSKSLGNFFTVREVLPYLRHPEVLRGFLLMSHYRGPINYTPGQLLQADAALTRLYTALRGLPEPEAASEHPASAAGGQQAAPATSALGAHRARFEAALDDDFNTPEALAVLQGLARELNAARARSSSSDSEVMALAGELRFQAALLGLLRVGPEQWFRLTPSRSFAFGQTASGASATEEVLDEARIEALIQARLAARAARDFKTADRIRTELKQAGVELEDQSGGRTSWKRA